MVVLSTLAIFLLLFLHVSLDIQREAKDIHTTVLRLTLLAVGIRPEESVCDWVGPLLVVMLGIDASANEVLVELWLLRVERFAFELVYRCS